MPETLPAFTALRVDAEDYLWAQRFRPESDSTERWGIFSPDGEFLGHVAMPPGLLLHEIGGEYILGIAKDDDGVEQVRVHVLRRRRP